jgi:hypothetical protein
LPETPGADYHHQQSRTAKIHIKMPRLDAW